MGLHILRGRYFSGQTACAGEDAANSFRQNSLFPTNRPPAAPSRENAHKRVAQLPRPCTGRPPPEAGDRGPKIEDGMGDTTLDTDALRTL